MPRNRVQNALRQRKQDEASASLTTGQPQEKAYDCFFRHDDLPSPMENGTLCTLPLNRLDGFSRHEEHFPLYTGQRLTDMVDSIRRLGVQTPTVPSSAVMMTAHTAPACHSAQGGTWGRMTSL